MTRQRALRLAREWSQGHVCSLRDGEAAEYHSMFAAMLEEAPPNEPLTIEELREMNGEPVYVHNLFPAKRKFEWQWALVCKERGNAEATTYTYRFLDYGKTWIAYRRPPEGEEDT